MDGEVAGIGALLRPNKYSILKFVNIHPGSSSTPLETRNPTPETFVSLHFAPVREASVSPPPPSPPGARTHVV